MISLKMYRSKIVLICFFVTLNVIWADGNLLKGFVPKKPWIKTDDFIKIIELSLNTSRCANIGLFDNDDEALDLLSQFLNVYPYEYTINKIQHWCNGFIAIASSVAFMLSRFKNIPMKISTTELLMIIDAHVDASSQLFNGTLYENANVNIITRNGFWTLQENYLVSRKFKNITRSRLKDMRHKRGIVDLKGRTLQVAAFYSPPLCYLNTTENRTVNGIEGQFYTATERPELDGIELQLFLIMAEQLNFTWMIRKPKGPFRYGRKVGDTWNGGMIGQILHKEVDIGFTGIWLEHDHYLFANLSKPWIHLNIHFLVPRPKPSASFWALTRPFSPEVWFTVFFMITLQSIYVYTRAWMNLKLPQKYRSFITTWTELAARLVGISMSQKIDGLRLQFYLWHIFGLIIVTAYSSILAADLATSNFERRIDTTKQFIAANLTWGREGPIPKFNNYFGTSDPWAVKLKNRFQHEENETQRHMKIVRGNYAILGRVIGPLFFPENIIRDEDWKNFRLMKNRVGFFYTSFVVQPWLLESIDKVMLRMQQSGLIDYHLRNVLHRRASAGNYEVMIEHDGPEEGAIALTITPLGAAFLMLAFGLLLSTFIFYLELKSVAGTNSVISVLVEIKKNRERKKGRVRKFFTAEKKLKKYFVANKR